jgi:hypothetical protein
MGIFLAFGCLLAFGFWLLACGWRLASGFWLLRLLACSFLLAAFFYGGYVYIYIHIFLVFSFFLFFSLGQLPLLFAAF